jgi:hypothetical protein
MIVVNGRVAVITKIYNNYAWRLRFNDNGEIVNIFYHQESPWAYCLTQKITD